MDKQLAICAISTLPTNNNFIFFIFLQREGPPKKLVAFWGERRHRTPNVASDSQCARLPNAKVKRIFVKEKYPLSASCVVASAMVVK